MSARADGLGGLDRLGVDDRSRGLGLAACGGAAGAAHRASPRSRR